MGFMAGMESNNVQKPSLSMKGLALFLFLFVHLLLEGLDLEEEGFVLFLGYFFLFALFLFSFFVWK